MFLFLARKEESTPCSFFLFLHLLNIRERKGCLTKWSIKETTVR